MPFIKKERREVLDAGKKLLNPKPGDYCYVEYKKMVDRWRDEPSWTTADAIYHDSRQQDISGMRPNVTRDLAWQVFFNLHVMPYELEKRRENGDI